jgi:hypothetical protein
MSEDLSKYNWGSNDYTRMPGTEDWIEVADLGEGGYEWSEFKAFYSPSSRRYFWHGDSGCSCNSWTDDLNTASDFEDGNLAALLRAWETFSKEHSYSTQVADYLSGVQVIKAFKEPSA